MVVFWIGVISYFAWMQLLCERIMAAKGYGILVGTVLGVTLGLIGLIVALLLPTRRIDRTVAVVWRANPD
jgi:hypothetical protein